MLNAFADIFTPWMRSGSPESDKLGLNEAIAAKPSNELF